MNLTKVTEGRGGKTPGVVRPLPSNGTYLNVSILSGNLMYGLSLSLTSNAHLMMRNNSAIESRKNMSFWSLSFMFQPIPCLAGEPY